ncbi:hypothetical protein DFH11DRAFT_1583995 [Phellopilus nigrolimitatus]|nr:hypothetical protein DFH11DRAFT_1583995 [Phellopilus nigrolimitatus]
MLALAVNPRTKGPTASRMRCTRRPLQAVDTNVASYDRKDPFAAFNVLRKLLTALPSRIGGCQFKLTQEEQKLSIHLLAIVEPFIGFSPSRHTLTRQSTEVLDGIVTHIDSKRDLLALALSCKRMHDIVFPRHYEYRVVRCKISNIAVWGHFAGNRSVAANVRRLEILDERSTENTIIPSDILATDTELESSDDELGMHSKQGRLFSSALAKMCSLNVFIWSCNHSLISLQSIWPTILKCHSLKSVEINDNLVFGPIVEGTTGVTKHPTILPRLSSVAVRSISKGYGQSKNAELTRVTDMLHHCPNLEELDIRYTAQTGFAYPRADDFFLYGRWPSLRTLTLTHLSCTIDGFDAVATFLAAHSNIEVLHLDVGPRTHLATLALVPGTLPRLRELRCNKEFACAVMACPSDSVLPRPLETIKGMRLTGQRDHAFFDALRRQAIKRVELAGYNEFEDIRKLVDCLPNVTWLDIGKKSSSATHKGPMSISSVLDWANLLAQLPGLTTFHGARFFYEVTDGHASFTSTLMSDRSRIRKNDEVASVIAWKCPNLRRLDHWDEHAGKVIVLLKDGEKAKWEIKRVKV